jgi:hypothetical protein
VAHNEHSQANKCNRNSRSPRKPSRDPNNRSSNKRNNNKRSISRRSILPNPDRPITGTNLFTNQHQPFQQHAPNKHQHTHPISTTHHHHHCLSPHKKMGTPPHTSQHNHHDRLPNPTNNRYILRHTLHPTRTRKRIHHHIHNQFLYTTHNPSSTNNNIPTTQHKTRIRKKTLNPQVIQQAETLKQKRKKEYD